MENLKLNNHMGLIFLGLFLGLGSVVSSQIIMNGVKEVKSGAQVIAVKGYAEKLILSDTAIWHINYGVREDSLPAAYKKLKEHDHKVKDFLIANGIPESKIIMQPSLQQPRYKKISGQFGPIDSNEIESYEISRALEINSKDVELIKKSATSFTELTSEGLEITQSRVSYFYSKLDEIKTELLGMATQNAYERAKILAKNSNSSVGGLKAAQQGVFQFTPKFSTETSDYGVLDSSSIEKMARAVVSASFSIK